MDMDLYESIASDLLEANGFSGWEVVDECVLLTPNGHYIEWDGESPDGEISPMILLGII